MEDSVDYDSLLNPTSETCHEIFSSLSSGQSILVMSLTQVVAYIQPESIILYDEPELHLHPDAVNGLLRAFDKLLKLFDSYAIVATHSPILLQEIPSKYVRIIRRFDNTPSVSKLGIESFGEDLTSITEDVFEAKGRENNYRTYFRKLIADGHNFNEIEAMFDNRLSFNARSFLSSLEGDEDATL